MMKLLAVYERGEGLSFGQSYYLEQHIPLARDILDNFGLIGIEADIFDSVEDVLPAKLFAMTHALFDNTFSPADVLAAEATARIAADVSNYTNASAYLQVARVCT